MDKTRTPLQIVLLVLLAGMAVVFAILTAVFHGSSWVLFEGSLLSIPQNGTHTGRVDGANVTIICYEDGEDMVVQLTVEDHFTQEGRVTPLTGSIRTDTGRQVPRVQVSLDGEILFTGGYDDDAEYAVLAYYNEDGSLATKEVGLSSVVVQDNGYSQDPWDGYALDAATILESAYGPSRHVRGSWTYYLAALIGSLLCALDAAFPKALFSLRNGLMMKDPEPTDFYLQANRVACVACTALLFGVYLYGLVQII